MKTLHFFAITFLFFVFNQLVYAQTNKSNSVIVAQNAYFVSQGKQITIDEALKGVFVRDELELVVELDKESLTKVGNTLQKFEINWYRYGSRGLYLTDSFVQEINLGQLDAKTKNYTLSSKRKNLQEGWWIIKIIAYSDDAYVTFEAKTQFKIKVL